MWLQRLVICQKKHKAGAPEEREVVKDPRLCCAFNGFSLLRAGFVIQLHIRIERRRDGDDCYG